MKVTYFLKLGLSILLIAACSSLKTSREEVLSGDTPITQLHNELQKAKGNNISILAPTGYEKAETALEKAIRRARKDENGNAGIKQAQKGLQDLKEARNDAKTSKKIFEEVLDVRNRAREARAASLLTKKFNNTEEQLKEATALVERGKLNDAREMRPNLIKSYSSLEIRSLKKGTLKEAKEALADAKNKEADDYAPKTFQLAKKEINLAANVLEADRGQMEKAGFHAEKGKALAQKAAEIAILAKSFERRDYTREETILWHQEQMKEATKSLDVDLPFNKGHQEVVAQVQSDIKAILEAQKNLREIVASKDEKLREVKEEKDEAVAKLKAEKGEILSQSEKREQRLKEQREKFEYLQSLFDKKNARVFREGDKVIIKADGFDFPVGESEISTRNFALLDKIVESIKRFPEADVFVSGHTDATGDKELNLKLSKERAQNVATFLKEVGKISADRISSTGMGEAEPVASNNTKKGRALNRRIEVEIQNIQ